MSYTEERNLPEVAQAFDTIEWNFLIDTLNKFKFGPEIQNWVKIFFTTVCVTSCVLNNGHASEFFVLKEGFDKVALCPDCFL